MTPPASQAPGPKLESFLTSSSLYSKPTKAWKPSLTILDLTCCSLPENLTWTFSIYISTECIFLLHSSVNSSLSLKNLQWFPTALWTSLTCTESLCDLTQQPYFHITCVPMKLNVFPADRQPQQIFSTQPWFAQMVTVCLFTQPVVPLG